MLLPTSPEATAYRNVRRAGGEIVQKFSQLSGAPFQLLNTDDRLREGICRSLAIRWLGFAKDTAYAGGKSFWDWLMPNGQLDKSALVEVSTQFVAPGHSAGHNESISNNTYFVVEKEDPQKIIAEMVDGNPADIRDELGFRGLQPSNPAAFGAGGAQSVELGLRQHQAFEALSVLAINTAPNGMGFGLINIRKAGTVGHAMAVTCRVNANEFRFFDPNLGEILFPDAGSFRQWLMRTSRIAYQDYVHARIRWFE